MQINKSVLGIGFTLGLVAAMASCSIDREVTNPEFCWNAAGDATCAARYADEGLFYCSQEGTPCTADGYYGCVSERPAMDECYSPCGGQKSIIDDSSCLGVADEGSETGDSGSSTDSMGSSDSSSDSTDDSTDADTIECGCASDSDCGGLTPVCECECVACSAENGAPCMDDWMACDSVQNACVVCIDCPSKVCNHSTGQCVADGLHVDADGGRQFDSIQGALSFIDQHDVKDGTIILHESDLGYLIESSLPTIAGVSISIIAAQGESPSVSYWPINDLYLFQVSNGGSLYLAGFEVLGKRGVSVVSGGTAHLESMTIVTELKSLSVDGMGHATISNSMLTRTTKGSGVVGVINDSEIEITFSTIYNTDTKKAIDCGGNANSVSVGVRNSIVTNVDGTLSTNCFLAEDAGNVFGGEAPKSWFVDATDLHLVDPGKEAAAGLAKLNPGDPTYDIDGQIRPPSPFTTYAGADVP